METDRGKEYTRRKETQLFLPPKDDVTLDGTMGMTLSLRGGDAARNKAQSVLYSTRKQFWERMAKTAGRDKWRAERC
jgi:hypothetical protein